MFTFSRTTNICIKDYSHIYELLDWAGLEKKTYGNWNWLSRNPAAIDLIRKNPKKINWEYLSENPADVELLKKYRKKTNCGWLSLYQLLLIY